MLPRVVKFALWVVMLLFVPPLAVAQDEPSTGKPPSLFEEEIQRIVQADDNGVEDAKVDLLGNLSKLLQFESAAPLTRRRLLDQWRTRRTDVQTGSSGGAGTTTTVIDPLLPATFGFAIENGSITRTIDGTTATIKVNPAGLFCASGAMETDSRAALRDTGCLDLWRRVGVSLSFDAGRGQGEGTEGLMALGDQFAEAAVRVELLNQRNPETEGFRNAITRWERSAKPLADVLVDVDEWLNRSKDDPDTGNPIPDSDRRSKVGLAIDPDLEEARQIQAQADLQEGRKLILLDQKKEQIMGKLREEAKLLLAEMPSDIRGKLEQSIPLWLKTLEIDDENYNRFAHGWVITAEYAFQRPDIATEAIGDIVPAGMRPPSLHTARLIAAKGVPTRNLDFTLNLSSSWFNELRPGLGGRWRDLQVGGQAKLRLGQIRSFGSPALSLAGLWLHLAQPPLGFMVPTFEERQINQPGNVGVFQAKLELPTANASVRVPISFTYASRTELVQESDVRGQIGISLNLDALFPN